MRLKQYKRFVTFQIFDHLVSGFSIFITATGSTAVDNAVDFSPSFPHSCIHLPVNLLIQLLAEQLERWI